MSNEIVMHPQSATSESLGFHPPHFSDDVAWLPNWLQSHVATMAFGSKDEEQDPQKHGACSVKEVGQFRDSISEDKDSYSLFIKDSRKEGLRLHLSGDDDSPVPGTSCRDKQVLQFTLHLSTDGSSGSCFFPIETSQDKRMMLIQQSVEDIQRSGDLKQVNKESDQQSVEDIQGSGDLKQLNKESNHGSLNLFSSTSYGNKSAESQALCNPQSSRKQSLPKPNSNISEDKEISNAVEHSTAASEALVIYDLMKSEPSSGQSSIISILELALKVKQTRLEWLNDILTFSNSNDTISRSDVLSDLDDFEMEDAYGDVGLSCSKYPNITSVSQVAETLVSRENLVEHGAAGSKQKSHENHICSDGAVKQLGILHSDLAVDSADKGQERIVMNHDCLNLTPSITCGDDLMMHQSTSDEINVRQKEDPSGGAKLRGIQHFRENLTVTSYLSESADVAPDLNSCVNTHDRSLKFSQSSIQIEGLYREEMNGPLLSQDIAKDSNLSSVDPLCSVIPCSVSSRVHDYLPAHFHNDEEHNGDEEMMPEFDLEAQNMRTMSCPNEIISSEKQDNSTFNSVESNLNHRHTISLDTNSVQSPGKPCFLQNDCNLVQAQQAEDSIDADTRPHILCPGARHRVQAHKHPIFTENVKQYPFDASLARVDPKGILQNPRIQDGKFSDTGIQTRKRVHFNVEDVEYHKKRDPVKLTSKYGSGKNSFLGRKDPSDDCWTSQEVKEHLTNFDMKDKKKRIFRGLEFLLTGFPCKREKEVERIIRRYGGAVLAEIPSPQKKGTRRIRSDSVPLPIVICTKKLRTRKFLYGCAVSAFLLQVDWILDSIQAGSVIQPEKYLILPDQQHRWANRIQKPIRLRTVDLMFCKVGIMLHGDHGFCLKLAEVIKHGQGCVYKSLQGMVHSLKNKNISVGIIIADNESYATRHLRECASEQKVPVMSTSWIINCIYSGKLLPFEENNSPSRSAPIEIQPISASQQWTQEI